LIRYEDFLDNLENLPRKDILCLADNTELYYSEYSENQQSKIKELLKLASYDDFPNNFILDNVKIDVYGDKIYFKNSHKQICFIGDNGLIASPILYSVGSNEFLEKYKEAYTSHKQSSRWRAFTKVNAIKEFDNYITKDGGIVSLDDDDIKIICRNSGIKDSNTGVQLLTAAIENGGRKTESYARQFNLFIKNGFTPISICKFDIKTAPKAWLDINKLSRETDLNDIDVNLLRAQPEDIIFYIYTGNTEYIDFNEWVNSVEYSDSYDEAKAKRDNILLKLMEGH